MVATDYRQAFEVVNSNGSPDWLRTLRADGFAHYERVGWPTRRDEEWKYTSTKDLQEQRFALAPADGSVSESVLQPWRIASSLELVFVDGRYRPDLSLSDAVPAGVTLETLAGAPESLKDGLSRPLAENESMFAGLNAALLQDGLLIRVSAKTVCEPIIHILETSSARGEAAMVSPRHALHIETSAQATVVHTVVSGGDAATFTNAVTDMQIAANGQLAYALIQAENAATSHMHNTRIHMAGDSRLDAFCLTTGGRWVRNDLSLTLDGSNIDATANGLYLPKGDQHIDNHTLIDHQEPNSLSNQLYKGVLSDNGRAVFNGKIFVRPIAQQTNAYQLNRNLLLSPTAEADTKPQLEIFADDVRCTHGATIGPVNPEEIFYLESRGIGRRQAIRMLAEGYARETLDHCSDARLHDALGRALVRSLSPAEPAS